MPIQAPQWTDYLNCPVCCREFGAPPRSPISLSCGHTLCRHCIKHLHRKQCPFDQTVIQVEPEDMVVNTALLQLVGYTPPAQPYHPPCIQALPERDRQSYDVIVKCMEQLAVYLKYCSNANNNLAGSRLSRPMQRKLVTLLQCTLTDEEGRGRAARAARSLGERTVTEFILLYQNPQQLSANLWAAVRARGCQFLGPAMQEEVLKLVLLALEDGSALSRKVLVMFVVQRLEPHFPQASKTSIGHVVQLLYRASCFKVSKRECDSSLMQLKEEFRTYESLRREHDAQIVQIATEAGLRIAPDQWSSLLYGDTAHKSHMQSIIDKLQTPQSFAQSVQEMFIALQRTGDPAELIMLSFSLDRLANIDASPDAKSPTWQQLSEVMTSVKEVVTSLIRHLQLPTAYRPNKQNQSSTQMGISSAHGYKAPFCRDSATRAHCIRGHTCNFTHSDDVIMDNCKISDNHDPSLPSVQQDFPPANLAATNVTISLAPVNDRDPLNMAFSNSSPQLRRSRQGGYVPQMGKRLQSLHRPPHQQPQPPRQTLQGPVRTLPHAVPPRQNLQMAVRTLPHTPPPRQNLQVPVRPMPHAPAPRQSMQLPGTTLPHTPSGGLYQMQSNLPLPKVMPQIVQNFPSLDQQELEAIGLGAQPLMNCPPGMMPLRSQCNDIITSGYDNAWLGMQSNPETFVTSPMAQCMSTTNNDPIKGTMGLMTKPPSWQPFDRPSTSTDWRVVGPREQITDEDNNNKDGSDDQQLEERLQALESQFDEEYEGTD